MLAGYKKGFAFLGKGWRVLGLEVAVLGFMIRV